jgi:hypothetical protein
VRGGKAIPKSTANLQAAQQNASTAQQPEAMAMLMKQRMSRRKIPPTRGLTQAQSHGLMLADASARNLRHQASVAARGAAPLQQAHRAGQAAQPYLAYGAGTAALGAGASATNSAMQGGREVIAGTLAEKLAARIINADVGLDAIIAHIKAAKVKKIQAAA